MMSYARLTASLLILSAAPALATETVNDANLDKVIQVFLMNECVLTPDNGAKAEQAAGLSTEDFSKAIAVLEKRGDVKVNPATLEFRLNHKDCP
jgi:hypothetical protein